MADPDPKSFLADPLSDITRKERRNLIAASFFGVLVAYGGFIPTKVTTFGIELSNLEQTTFVTLVLGVVLYFFLAFTIYGLSDFVVWRKTYLDYLRDLAVASENVSYEDAQYEDYLFSGIPSAAWIYSLSGKISYVRIGFEFGVPMAAGVLSMAALFLELRGA